MIFKKTWVKKGKVINIGIGYVQIEIHYTGWFLFGFIPLYIIKEKQ